ncbi:MAG: hypothetical protein ABI665_00120 [Vicinamibacterales bacterium]
MRNSFKAPFLLTLTAACFASATVAAQQQATWRVTGIKNSLKGIDSVAVLYSIDWPEKPIRNDIKSEYCGLSGEELIRAAVDQLREQLIEEKSSFDNPDLIVNAMMIQTSGKQCVAAIRVELETESPFGNAILNHQNVQLEGPLGLFTSGANAVAVNVSSAKIVLLSENGLLSGGSSLRDQAGKMIREFVARIATKIREANPR